MTKEETYERMTVQFIHPHPEIECEFGDAKPCSELYGRMDEARLRLAERTGLDFEDRDILEMIESLEQIAKICALKMFDYGVLYGT